MLVLSIDDVALIAKRLYSIAGSITKLHGEIDLNFKIETSEEIFLLKIVDAADADYLDFIISLHNHVDHYKPSIQYSKILNNNNGNQVELLYDKNNRPFNVRLHTWTEGRLWSSLKHKHATLRENLGKHNGLLTQTFQSFSHPYASRNFPWDLAQAAWTLDYLHLFEGEKLTVVQYFQNQYLAFQDRYKNLRKQVIHNDVNDNNIILSNDLASFQIEALIDYGDSVYSQLINDVAVTVAYAAMEVANPLQAGLDIVKGYHSTFPLLEEELAYLYTLVGMRLVISVTKSAINKIEHPENEYLQISDRMAWDLLLKWKSIHPSFAHYNFRAACGYTAHPQEKVITDFIKVNPVGADELFKNKKVINFQPMDLSVSSTFFDSLESNTDAAFEKRVNQILAEEPSTILVGGYKEPRTVYTTDNFKQITNDGFCYRTLHLGVDFWSKAGEEIFVPYDGEIVTLCNNNYYKDYGPLIIVKHAIDGDTFFYTLYGHLSLESLDAHYIGKKIKKGEYLASLGDSQVNGNWPPHLHFQIILDTMGHNNNFDGVGSIREWDVYKSLCPDPNLILNLTALQQEDTEPDYLSYRKEHLGKSLSLSYQKPLTIMRGQGVYLYDQWAQPYLDTVNNVPHVGHQNPKVVKAGQQQMAILNTNTRYLHPKINEFAKALLKKFTPELCVVHFVNSGSEANELAMRMARTVTGQKDIVALEMGYHGNTQGCVDISSYKFNRKGGAGKPEHTAIVPLPDAFRGKYRGGDTASLYANHIEQEIQGIKSKGRGIAAFIAESIVSCGGQIDLPYGYLKKAYEIVRSHGGLCIADEVQTGFGRVGEAFWGFELHDVIPDIVVMGKPIGNGHPLAAVVCTKAIAEGFANGMEFFNTFGGNPVSCAIGHAVLKEIEERKLQQNALEVGQYLTMHLKEMQTQFPLIADVRGKGLFLGIEFLDPDGSPATAEVKYIAERMKERFILMSIDGPDNNVLKIKPPIVFSKEDADVVLSNLREVMGEDFLQYPTGAIRFA
jgi:4-aminobutyrate aminotransferase-like enzyme/Ser/Thr protein kinase RdoA (MazF antagonist)